MISESSTHESVYRQSSGSLSAFPRELLLMSDLKGLHLTGNQFRDIPDDISRLRSLERLSIARNHLRVVTPSIAALASLAVLDLSNNDLSDLPRLPRLKSLRLDSNDFCRLPDAVMRSSTLASLSMADNPLTSIGNEISKLVLLTRLELRGCLLTDFPDGLFELAQLEALHCANNKLTQLSPLIAKLNCLTTLTLSGNELTWLPSQLAHTTALSFLLISNNALLSLPDALGSLPLLQYIEFHRNPFSADSVVCALASERAFLVHKARTLLVELRHRNARRLRAAARVLAFARVLLAPTHTPLFAVGRGSLAHIPSHVLREILLYVGAVDDDGECAALPSALAINATLALVACRPWQRVSRKRFLTDIVYG
jgi:hypothetical protein